MPLVLSVRVLSRVLITEAPAADPIFDAVWGLEEAIG